MMDLGTSLMTGLKLLLSPVVEECWYSHKCTCVHAHTHTHTQTIGRHAGHVFIQSLCRYPTAMHFDDADKGLPHSIPSLSPPSLSLLHLSHPPKHTHTHTHTHTHAHTYTVSYRVCVCVCVLEILYSRKLSNGTNFHMWSPHAKI